VAGSRLSRRVRHHTAVARTLARFGALRANPESKKAKIDRQLIEEATKWVGGLDRIHKARRILRCFDFSATPFSPSGKQSSEESLFNWIVSDFGLNDAIEGGLVKTPRVVVRDDGMPDPPGGKVHGIAATRNPSPSISPRRNETAWRSRARTLPRMKRSVVIWTSGWRR
jgi:hypothetical protein